MGHISTSSVRIIKKSLYCYSCYNSEMVILPRISGAGSFSYICPICKNTEYNEHQYPIISYVPEEPAILEHTIKEIFASLIAFSDLPKYVNSEDQILQDVIKRRLQEGV